MDDLYLMVIYGTVTIGTMLALYIAYSAYQSSIVSLYEENLLLQSKISKTNERLHQISFLVEKFDVSGAKRDFKLTAAMGEITSLVDELHSLMMEQEFFRVRDKNDSDKDLAFLRKEIDAVKELAVQKTTATDNDVTLLTKHVDHLLSLHRKRSSVEDEATIISKQKVQ